MNFIKKIQLIIFSIILSVLINITYYKIVNQDNYWDIISKSVSFNYLSFEPIVQRGMIVKNFDNKCIKKTDCLPFIKNKNSLRIEFIKELQKVLREDSNSLVFVSMFLVDGFLDDLRFYIKNPIYIDTKVLGITYYAKNSFFLEYIRRFSIAYSYHYCNGSLENNHNKSRVKYLNKLFEIFNLKVSCKDKYIEKLKDQKIEYVIDEKKYLKKNKILFCKEEFCLALL